MLFALKASIVEAQKYNTQELALDYIVRQAMFTPINMTPEEGKKKQQEFTENVLNNDLYPHCKTQTQKLYFMGFMTNKLLQTSFGWRTTDDRDSYKNKRIDLCGVLLNNLFRNYFNKLVKDMQKQTVREINNGSWKSTDNYKGIINQTNIYKIIKSTTIENGIKRALATGDFGIKNTNSNKVGVAQVLSRLTYISSLSHLRRINTPIDKSGKLIPPRKLHNTQWGMVCAAESPEGQSVGVVKNLAYMAHIAIASLSQPIHDVIEKFIEPLENFTFEELYGKVKVIVNGNWLGTVKNPYDFYLYMKEKKYQGIINIYTSVVFDFREKEIHICNDAGRIMRPIYRVKNNKLLITQDIAEKIMTKKLKWDDLLVNHDIPDSIIEYIDASEQNSSLIAINRQSFTNKKTKHYKYTHCEIHPFNYFRHSS